MAFGGVGSVASRARAHGWRNERPTRPIDGSAAGQPATAWAAANACPELDCVRHLLPDRVVAAAERRALALGIGADRVLICADFITEEAYLLALARSLGTSYQPLDEIARADCPLDDDCLIGAAATGWLPLRYGSELVWIVAPHDLTARQLVESSRRNPPALRCIRLTSSGRLRNFVERHGESQLGRRAAESLRRRYPLLSNAPRTDPQWIVRSLAIMAAAMTIIVCFPAFALQILCGLLSALFVATAFLRLLSPVFGNREPAVPIEPDDSDLPIYTVICALYREAPVVAKLVAAIRALDYPPEKLDVKLVIEADDKATQRALARLELGPPFEIVVAPRFGPRTKPKALNAALPFARGAYTAVYDAEDEPEPDQLRRAVAAFRNTGKRLACLQASLTIDNTTDNLLTRMFTADYAGQFDVFLPSLAAMNLPIPLGGSSNHFRTVALRKVGGWDPYNVTEDADLGIRLYRFGYRTTNLASSTYEEAPGHFGSWLSQRSRWYKGWIQTWLVHMRRPRRLLRELGGAGAIALQLLLGANVLAALIHPFFMAGLAYMLFGSPPALARLVLDHAIPAFAVGLSCGYASTMLLNIIGLWRRGLLAQAWIAVFTPLHWLLLSFAAWRAVFQLLGAPQRWDKTEHGFAKSSRLAASRRNDGTDCRRRPEPPRRTRGVRPSQVSATIPIGPTVPIAPMSLIK